MLLKIVNKNLSKDFHNFVICLNNNNKIKIMKF